jgi:hypothetical protein
MYYLFTILFICIIAAQTSSRFMHTRHLLGAVPGTLSVGMVA